MMRPQQGKQSTSDEINKSLYSVQVSSGECSLVIPVVILSLKGTSRERKGIHLRVRNLEHSYLLKIGLLGKFRLFFFGRKSVPDSLFMLFWFYNSIVIHTCIYNRIGVIKV